MRLTPKCVKLRQMVNYLHSSCSATSSGGVTDSAFEFGRAIHRAGALTMVPQDTVCVSACALILLAGRVRGAHGTSQIGFHQGQYRALFGLVLSIGGEQYNPAIREYLTDFGMNSAVQTMATNSRPNDMLWLTGVEAKRIGLATVQYELLEGFE